jgi:hypothetical protein
MRRSRNQRQRGAGIIKEALQQNQQLLFSGYVEEVEAKECFFEREESWNLAVKYLSKISDYYHENLKFVPMMTLSSLHIIWSDD